jgi:anti-anti-sigma factor
MQQAVTSSNAPIYKIDQLDRERRLFILKCLIGMCILFSSVLVGVMLVVGDGASASLRYLIFTLSGSLVTLILAFIVSLGKYLEAATHIFFLIICITILIIGLPTGLTSTGIFCITIPAISAPMFLRPYWSFVYAAIGTLSTVIIQVNNPRQANFAFMITDLVLWVSFFIIVSTLSYLSANVYEKQLILSNEKNQALIKTQAELEERVAERTRDIQQAMDELRIQTETIRLLNVPILPVADNVLALPLVGTLDSQRMQSITEQLLDAINREKARFVLIDITGVPVVDSYVAGALLRTAQAVRLLGAEPILVGMKGEVAQMLVGLGANLSDIISLRDIRTGITYTRGLVEQQSSSRNNLSSYIN